VTDSKDITEVTGLVAMGDDEQTRLAAARESGRTFFKHPADDTQLTCFTPSSQTSSGFAQAQALAAKAQAGSGIGSLLKKRFYLEAVLGQGGMGTVYLTRDLRKIEAEDPNPYIATKVLNSAFKNHPDAFVTLQQETAKSHALAHPNIVTVHDFDRDGDILFMTMELLEGEPLDRLLKALRPVAGSSAKPQGIPKARALAMVRDLCAALAYAHQRQIIHADFKPGNVFVCNDGTTKVLDFGIARAASKESQKHKFDAAQLGALTPAYATAEMVRDQPLTFTDDVYALACVAYEIFTGQHPYQHRSALEAKERGLKPKPAAGLNHREWRALSRALALDKQQRTATVREFMAEMFPRRNTLAFSAAVSLAVVALGGAAWFGYSQHRTKVQIQNTIADNINQAQLCFAQSDFACAQERALVAANLDATNKVAGQLLHAAQLALQKQMADQKMLTLLNEGEACLAAKDDACAQVKSREALALDGKNLRAQQLSVAANNLEQSREIGENVDQAETCLQQKNMACAEMFARRASDLNANHPSVRVLLAKLQLVQHQTRLAAQAQQQKIADQLNLAQDCLNQKKYDCAIQQANSVLTMDAANGKAMEVKQSAAVMQQQGRDADGRIAKILQQARECLEKQKNYSCAIAKAEAALDLSPGNSDAFAIKTRAQETQRKIKETGFTIK
jgi:hypothetical protein